MQQKLKRIKTRKNAQKNLTDIKWNKSSSCKSNSNKKPDIKMRSCKTASKTAAQLCRDRLILPNRLKRPPPIKANNHDDDDKENTNYLQQRNSGNSNSNSNQNQHSRTTTTKWSTVNKRLRTRWLSLALMRVREILVIGVLFLSIVAANTTPFQPNSISTTMTMTTTTTTTPTPMMLATTRQMLEENSTTKGTGTGTGTGTQASVNSTKINFENADDSIFMRFARRISTGNELWDGIIRDCYQRPSFSCFQNNVYTYLNGALETGDVNVTQRLKLYKNNFNYNDTTDNDGDGDDDGGSDDLARERKMSTTTEAGMKGRDVDDDVDADVTGDADGVGVDADEHLLHNEIPHYMGRSATTSPETPIEEITTALYGKSVKFAMTHDIEIQLPEMLFDGATFRISPRGFEGNGIIAKLELIPKQEIQARLAGKILMNKIKKFLRSKLLLSFLALLLIIKIIKIKLFWLLPLVIGVGAAKKLLLKFLLFLFPALAHLFKLCSYYQQTYHSTKYHHHLHHIDHHHTIVPPWHAEPHHPAPEIIYTSPPKGHISAYLHGAPIHETYGPPAAFEHDEGNWESSGPGLGSEYIADIHRAAEIDENTNHFKPNSNDGNILQAWGLGTPPPQQQQQQQQQNPLTRLKSQYTPQTQQQRPPPSLQQHQQQQLQQLLQKNRQYPKPQTTSHSFNPFTSDADKQSVFSSKYRNSLQSQSAPRPVYTPPRNAAGLGNQYVVSDSAAGGALGSNAAQIVALYEPTRSPSTASVQNNKQEPISPEIAAQLKEALRIQAEQRIIAQQQKILENQPFVQDGQPLMPKNYDPFYSPILLKIDKIIEQLGVADELCKERLVCSMYKDPSRYSPHSNFVSAELSRDTSELQPATTSTNPAVLRFYRLIQAARDGQDQRDCLRLYPECNVNTE